MFIDEATGVQINADLEVSVSHGTLRLFDVIPAFYEVVKDTPEVKKWREDQECYQHYDLDSMEEFSMSESDPYWESTDATEFCMDLIDVCDKYAPEGYYFGSSEGDGSDFGYWKYSY